jgi:tripartite-type tricarboxylate transporter receptor subunit TctC
VGIARVVHNPLLMVVHPSLPVKNLQELVAYAKANPGKVSFATGGSGSSPHMSMEMFRKAANLDMQPIHYKGDAAAMTDLLSGRVPIMMSSISGQLANVQSGKLRPVVVTGLNRVPQLPDVPTISESGFPKFEVITWWGLVAKAGTPRDIVDRIHRETVALVQQPAVREQFAKLGLDVATQNPAEFSAYIAEEAQRWGGLVKSLGLKAE